MTFCTFMNRFTSTSNNTGEEHNLTLTWLTYYFKLAVFVHVVSDNVYIQVLVMKNNLIVKWCLNRVYMHAVYLHGWNIYINLKI